MSPACESFCSLRTMSGRVMLRSTSCALPICSFCSTVCTSAALRMATTYVESKADVAGRPARRPNERLTGRGWPHLVLGATLAKAGGLGEA